MKKLYSLMLAAALLITAMAVPSAAVAGTDKAEELFMYIGSPIALSNGKTLPLDSENPDLVPFIHKGRTLVPLRMIGEHFGADVSYDAAVRVAEIALDGTVAQFPIDKGYYLLNGKEVKMDTETLISDGRTFVPMRVICENVLGMSIDYKDGVIGIAKTIALDSVVAGGIKDKIGAFTKLGSDEELKAYLKKNSGGMYYQYDEEIMEEAPPPMQLPQAADAAGESKGETDSAGGHSQTNVQVQGIDEGDIIKTDGKYIYIIAGDIMQIIDAQSGLKTAASVEIGQGCHAQDMYIDSDRVIVIGYRYDNGKPASGTDTLKSDMMIAPYSSRNYTFVKVYDTADKTAPRQYRYFEIEGTLTTSRKKDGCVYLLTNYSRWSYGADPVPLPVICQDGKLSAISYRDVMVSLRCPGVRLMTLSAIDIMDSAADVQNETIASGGYITYMSNGSLYVAGTEYKGGKETTFINKFSTDGTKIGYAGSGAVDGSLNNQFSMDEFDGNLRVATTIRSNGISNSLTVLDSNMEACGRVQGFAEGERIYSVRFIGKRGYIVTFRQVDPLFVFDLSDPTAPKITGELKVPGFSTYLHPVSEDVILGVGEDVYDIYRKDENGNDVVIGQSVGGVKVSLFDVSNAGQPREIDTLVLGQSGYAEVLYNHKAAMFHSGDGFMAFCGYSYGEEKADAFDGAYLISYAGDTLTEKGRIATVPLTSDAPEPLLYTGSRVIYIGDTLYYMQNGMIRGFDIKTLAEKQSLKLVRNGDSNK